MNSATLRIIGTAGVTGAIASRVIGGGASWVSIAFWVVAITGIFGSIIQTRRERQHA